MFCSRTTGFITEDCDPVMHIFHAQKLGTISINKAFWQGNQTGTCDQNMDPNIHNIAAWNAYKATLQEPLSPSPLHVQSHIPYWAKWFEPEPVIPAKKVIQHFFLSKFVWRSFRTSQLQKQDFEDMPIVCCVWLYQTPEEFVWARTQRRDYTDAWGFKIPKASLYYFFVRRPWRF